MKFTRHPLLLLLTAAVTVQGFVGLIDFTSDLVKWKGAFLEASECWSRIALSIRTALIKFTGLEVPDYIITWLGLGVIFMGATMRFLSTGDRVLRAPRARPITRFIVSLVAGLLWPVAIVFFFWLWMSRNSLDETTRRALPASMLAFTMPFILLVIAISVNSQLT